MANYGPANFTQSDAIALDVKSIEFDLKDGNDKLINRSNKISNGFGGLGNDFLDGGSLKDILRGDEAGQSHLNSGSSGGSVLSTGACG